MENLNRSSEQISNEQTNWEKLAKEDPYYKRFSKEPASSESDNATSTAVDNILSDDHQVNETFENPSIATTEADYEGRINKDDLESDYYEVETDEVEQENEDEEPEESAEDTAHKARMLGLSQVDDQQ